MIEKRTNIVVLETARSVWEHIAFVPEWRICTEVDLDEVRNPTLSEEDRRLLLEKLFADSPVYNSEQEAGTVACRASDDMRAAHMRTNLEPEGRGKHMPWKFVSFKSVHAFSKPLVLEDQAA
jgi:hypothetical protein